MHNIAILDQSYLEATGIDRILKTADFDIKTEHFLSIENFLSRGEEDLIDVLFIDSGTLNGQIENLTRQVKSDQPETYIVWLTPDEDPLTEFDAICAHADGCVAKSDFSAIVSAVKAAKARQVLFSKEMLLDFARQASVLFSRSGRQLTGLTVRERQVLELLRQGATNKEISSRLYISVETVKIHVKNIREKLGVVSRRQLIDGIPSRMSNAIV